MKTRTALLIVCAAALLFPGSRLQAETHASCCRCESFYKLSDEGFGYMRHHIGFCPKCTAEMGGDPEQYLTRLKGRHKGLSDAAALTNRRVMEADRARDQARDSIYGREGSATGFFTALIGLASEGAGGAIKKVGSGVKKGLGYYNKAADTLEGDLGWVLDEGKGWVEGKTIGAVKDKAKDKAILKAAAAIGRNHYSQTGDARGATKKFLGAHGDIKKGVSILESAIKFYEKTDKLANGIQDYLEHRADAERLNKEKDDLDDLAQKVQNEMDKLRHCLELQKQQGQSTDLHRPADWPAPRWAGTEDWTVRFASVMTLADKQAELKVPDEPDAAALKSALTALQRLRTELADFIRQLEEEMVPPLLPFWYDCQAELGRDLAKALLEWADPATDKAGRQYDRVIRYGQGIEADVKRAAPKGNKI